MKLLIVESPAKCKKIAEFLGTGWRVQATMGHIRALKEELEGIGFRDPAGWAPHYENIATKRDAIASLRRAATDAEVYLGSDDDREGEAIAWHTCAILKLNPATTPRVTFHEITEVAIRHAVTHPRTIDLNKFNAQQARTMLDLLIGFTLSPCLWRGVGFKAGLSAGRCQTPALRLIYDRDCQIESHVPSNSWRLDVTTGDGTADGPALEWRAAENCATRATAAAVLSAIATCASSKTITGRQAQAVRVTDIQERKRTSQPPKPFITSSLQQEASNRLRMGPKVTMTAAQKLYEAGHITYMRTDNAVLSQEALEAASAVVRERWGEDFLGGVSEPATDIATTKKTAKPKKKAAAAAAKKPVEAQQAHEAIRPTHMEVSELMDMDPQQQRLYALIWTRTIQSVMAPEVRDVMRLTGVIQSGKEPLTSELTTEWDRVSFAGYRAVEAEDTDDTDDLYERRRSAIGFEQMLPWSSIVATETSSSPPSRFTEASLIQELEKRGIGRPSTFATLVETVLDRGYVERATVTAKPQSLGVLTVAAATATPFRVQESTYTVNTGGERDKLRTTPLGRTVIEWLLREFGDMLEYDFTAQMEAQLDEVAAGARPWDSVLSETWGRYSSRYDAIMSGPTAAGAGVAKTNSKAAEYGDGYKMVVSKKGPLFVLERDGEKTRFASVPTHLSLQTATRADAEAAFAAAAATTTGKAIGMLDDEPVMQHEGRYGKYVVWAGHRISCKDGETLEQLTPRLRAAASPDAVDHQVGPYRIKRGPYGLYMYKTGGRGKPVFVGIPPETAWATLTPEGAEALYAAQKTATAAATAKPVSKAKRKVTGTKVTGTKVPAE